MRFLYILRVIFISIEAAILACALIVFLLFLKKIESLFISLVLNETVLNYLILLPFGMIAWVLKEARYLLQEDNETICILCGWGDYWRLKIHVWVTIGYSIIFAIMSLFPWFVKSGMETGSGFLFFSFGMIGQVFVSGSLYLARIKIKEIISPIKSK